MTTILLGPQRFATTAGTVVRSLQEAGHDGPVAAVLAGWQERESDDAELREILAGREVVNLRLWGRAVELLAADAGLRRAVLDHRAREEELRAFYGIRVQAAWDAVFAVRRRTSRTVIGEGAERAAMQALRDVDDWYSYEVARLYETTRALDAVAAHDGLAQQRAEVAELLAGVSVVCVAGGHVGVLMQCLRALDVALPADVPVVAWSAGAMAVCDPVILFHDFAPHGVTAPEVHDRGLGRVRGVVPLPHARRRLRLDDHARMSVFARRFPTHRLLLLDDGAVVRFESEHAHGGSLGRAAGGPALPEGARHLTHDGTIGTGGAQ